MNSNWEKFGEEIKKTVQDAVETQNYDKLNQVITETINQAADTVANSVKSVTSASKTTYRSYKTYTTDTERMKKRTEEKDGQRVPAQTGKALWKMPSRVGAILQGAFGSIFGGIWLFVSLVMFVIGLGIHEIGFAVLQCIGIFVGAAGVFVGVKGLKRFQRIERFERYLQILKGKEYCNVAELTEKAEKPQKQVIEDLEYMIRNDWFKQGHLDKQKTCLILTDEVYEQYRQLEQRKAAELKCAEEEKVQQEPSLSPEVQKVIEQGDAYVKKIRKCNDDIPGEEISEKIQRIEILVDRIFDRVEQEPKCVSDLGKLMDYYLPTTVKLLEAYAQMDAQPSQGENICTAKKEIEDTLDTLNVAFEKLLDSLFQETAWDVSSDISVLNAMLAQEGLNKSDFS